VGLDRGRIDVDGPDPDASPLERARREIAELKARVAELSADRTEWLTVLAHELRTPLTVICGYNRLLLSGEAGRLTDEQARYLDESTKSCRRLDAFIDRLLDGVHDGFLERGLEREANDLCRVVGDVCELLRPLMDGKGLRIDVDIASDARSACFDSVRIEQVLTNLLGNAIRYTKPGGALGVVARRIEAGADTGGVDRVEIAVVDQGPGIAPADRQRVFEPFVRLEESDVSRGLGLGLAICRRIVEAHDGSIAVTDEPGGGCRFTFTLPVADRVAGVS